MTGAQVHPPTGGAVEQPSTSPGTGPATHPGPTTRTATHPGPASDVRPKPRQTGREPRGREPRGRDLTAREGRAKGPELKRRAGRAVLAVPTLLLAAAAVLVAGGALLVKAGGAASVAGQRTVVLTMHHTHFQPAVVKVEPGTTVRFVLRNTDPIDHEFIVGDQAVHQRHRVGRDRHHHGEVPGEISVPSGTEASTTFRFDQPGRFAYICHLPGHEAYGMVGTVEVG